MRRIIYNGLNTKCLMLTACAIEHQEYDETIAKDTMKWFIEQAIGSYLGPTNVTYAAMVSNINPIKVSSKSTTYNGDEMWVNTYLLVYKLPERGSREVLQLLQNRSMRDRMMPQEGERPVPEAVFFKCIAGDGSYTSKVIIRDTNNREVLTEWFNHQARLDNKYQKNVLGIHTDSIGYKKHMGMDRYYYGTLPQYQITVGIYDDMAEAINDKEGFWIRSSFLSTANQDFGIARSMGKGRLNAFFMGNTLIVSDNINGISSIKDKLAENQYLLHNADIITTNQYSLFNGNLCNVLEITPSSGVNINVPKHKVVTLILVNKAKIIDIVPSNRNSNIIECTIVYDRARKPKAKLPVRIHRSFENMYGMGDEMSFAIPFEADSDIHLRALDTLKDYLTTRSDEEMRTHKETYLYTHLANDNGVADDVLMDWFRKCSATAKTDEEKLREAYKTLKDGLVKEYKDIEKYLAANDINTKKPIPAVRVEEEFAHSPLKKLGFEMAVDTLVSINYTRLETPVKTNYVAVSYMIPWVDRRGSKGFVKGNMPLNNFYDKTNNQIILNSNKIVAEHIGRMVR